MRRLALAATVLAGLAAGPAHAAYINIDDSDPNTITITAGDFEGGFFVNGNSLASGASVTLPDGIENSFVGSWLTEQVSGSGTTNIYFATPDNPTVVTSAVAVDWFVGDGGGTLVGGFAGYSGISYGPGSPTFPQDGVSHTVNDGFPFVTIQFISEPIPEPATLALLGAGLLGLGIARRRR